MVSLAEVEELLRREAEAFKAELQAVHEENVRITHKHEEVSHKYAEITHQLEMTRRDADATQRQRRAIEEGLPRLDSNIQRTESLKQNLQKLASTFDESKNDLEAALMVLQAKHANHSLELSRLYNHLTSAQGGASPTVMEIRSEHDRMRALIDEQEKMLGRTNARRDTVACDCTHKTINENMDKLRHRISNVCVQVQICVQGLVWLKLTLIPAI